MYSSRMHTTHTLPYRWGLPDRDPRGQRPTWIGTPLERDPPRTETPTPVKRITDRCKNVTLPQLRFVSCKCRVDFIG